MASETVDGGEVMVDEAAVVVVVVVMLVVVGAAVVETDVEVVLVLVLETMVVRESLPTILKISSRTYNVGFTPN